MEFIDNRGHIFSIDHNTSDLGWESADSEYVFWVNDAYAGPEISTGCYYVMQITQYIGKDNVLGTDNSSVSIKMEHGSTSDVQAHFNNIKEVTVTCDSSIFKVAGYKNAAGLSFDMTTDELSGRITSVIYKENELIVDETDGDVIAPFFVLCKSDEAGTLLTNLLVSIKYTENNKEYTVYSVIRVGGVFVDESEKLEINAMNFGKLLPKGILDAVYQASVSNGDGNILFDASLYNEKLKEYLMYRMEISGETGNYNSMRSALKWFGWGSKIEMSKLLKTDNKILEQYVRDYFDTNNDIIDCFNRFRNTALVSFKVNDNSIIYKKDKNGNELVVREPQKWDEKDIDFVGESIPETEDLFLKYIKSEMDDSEFDYYEPYYLYNKATIMLKLYFFKYYYKKYFCPVHTGIVSSSVEHRHIIQDYKMHMEACCSVSENPVFNSEQCIVDIFGDPSYDMYDVKKHTVHFYSQQHYIDRDYCEFSIYNKKEYYDSIKDTVNDANDVNCQFQVYETHEMCLTIPVSFWSCMEEKLNIMSENYVVDYNYIYNTTIIVSKYDTGEYSPTKGTYVEIYSANKRFVQSNENRFENIVIIPKLISKFKNKDIIWWTDGNYRIDIECNDRWFSQFFKIAVPEITADLGYLEYRYSPAFMPYFYDKTMYNYVKNEYSGTTMWEPSLVNVTNSDYISDLNGYETGENNIDSIIDKYKDIYNIPSAELAPQYYNVVIYYDLTSILNSWCETEEEYEYYTNYYAEWMSKVFSADDETLITPYLLIYNILNGWTEDDGYDSIVYPGLDPSKEPTWEEYIACMKILSKFAVDCYAMTDETAGKKKHYNVFISKYTIGDIINTSGNKSATVSDITEAYRTAIKIFLGMIFYQCDDKSMLLPENASARFLVNRMKIVKCGSSNNVPSNSILCCSLYKIENEYDENDIKKVEVTNRMTEETSSAELLTGQSSFLYESGYLPFKLDVVSSKWKFTPYSINIKETKTVTSKANTAIMSLQDSNSNYMSGYYNVEVEYSLDGKTTQTYKIPYKIRIK